MAAWLVHLYTATGGLLAFLAMIAATRGDARTAFLWMVAATVVDSTDGVLARRADVRTYAPAIDGGKLDDIVDYLTFVFLPAYLVYQLRMVPEGWATPAAAAMLLSSALGFSASDAKSADHFFTGFPSYWNIVVFYLYALRTDPMFNLLLVVGLAAMVFVRTGYVYPSRTPTWRVVTLVLGVCWGAAVAVSVWMLPAAPRPLVIGSLVFPVYYVGLSLLLQRSRRR